MSRSACSTPAMRSCGFDGMTPYYDVALKQRRHAMLLQSHALLRSRTDARGHGGARRASTTQFKPDVVIHLAAQAGVRYSLENPRAYVDSNLVGTFNVLELVRAHAAAASPARLDQLGLWRQHARCRSSRRDRADHPLTLYAATKKATELMAHSYAHLWNIPTTAFRFFTVYGPWGRPDMALFKFAEAILAGDADRRL